MDRCKAPAMPIYMTCGMTGSLEGAARRLMRLKKGKTKPVRQLIARCEQTGSAHVSRRFAIPATGAQPHQSQSTRGRMAPLIPLPEAVEKGGREGYLRADCVPASERPQN